MSVFAVGRSAPLDAERIHWRTLPLAIVEGTTADVLQLLPRGWFRDGELPWTWRDLGPGDLPAAWKERTP